MICLLAVFPCGAGLTVLGTLAADVVRSFANHDSASRDLGELWLPAVWAGSGVLGFLSLIYGVDQMLMAQRLLRWYSLLGILLGIVGAGFFSLTYPLRAPSAIYLRIVCVAPVAIELLLFILHLVRFLRGPIEPPSGALPKPAADNKSVATPPEAR